MNPQRGVSQLWTATKAAFTAGLLSSHLLTPILAELDTWLLAE